MPRPGALNVRCVGDSWRWAEFRQGRRLSTKIRRSDARLGCRLRSLAAVLRSLECWSRPIYKPAASSFPRPPDGHRDRHGDRQEATRCCDRRTNLEDLRRIGVEAEPPEEEGEGLIHPMVGDPALRSARLRLISQGVCRPLRRRPDATERDQQDRE